MREAQQTEFLSLNRIIHQPRREDFPARADNKTATPHGEEQNNPLAENGVEPADSQLRPVRLVSELPNPCLIPLWSASAVWIPFVVDATRQHGGRGQAEINGLFQEIPLGHFDPKRRQSGEQQVANQPQPQFSHGENSTPAAKAKPINQCPKCDGIGLLVREVVCGMYQRGLKSEAYTCPTCLGSGRRFPPLPVAVDGKMAAAGGDR